MGTRASSSCPSQAPHALYTRREDTHCGHTGLVLHSQARHTRVYTAGRIRTVGTRASSSSPVRLATRSAHTQGGYALWAHGPPAPQSGSPHALYTAGRIRTVGTRASSSSPVQARHTLCTHAGRIRTVGTRASSSSPVRLATRSAHTQGGYALWAHGYPPAPQSGSPQRSVHTGRIRTVGTRASSSSPVRLATRSVHTQGGYALWAHGPPPSSPVRLATALRPHWGGYALWAHGPPPAPQSGSPHALHTRREDTHCGHTGLLQLPSQARHTLCTHAGRIRTVSTRASSSSPVRLATRSAHTQGGYALWAHGPPPAPQSGSPRALHTRREDTHCGHTGLQLPSQARHTLCTHTGRIRTVSTRASSSSPVRLATRSAHTQGGYAQWAHRPPPAPQSGSPHALHTHREDTHCGHTGLLQLPSQARHTLCTHREDTHCGHTGLLQLPSQARHTLCTHAGRIRTVSTRASSSSPVRLATRSVHTQGGYALWAHGPPPAPQSGSPHALYTHREDTHCEHTGLLQLPSQARHTLCTHAGRIRTVSTRASSSSPVRLATRSVHTQGGYAL